jgi:hypothetical protein
MILSAPSETSGSTMALKQQITRLLPRSVVRKYREHQFRRRLPQRARQQERLDRMGLPPADPGPAQAIAANLTWLARAQDRSTTQDGGVARHFSLVDGWAPSYPETTGYIVPTVLAEAARVNDPSLRARAARMLDWLVRIQFPEGGFQGGTVTQTPATPVTFNNGQILLGLAAGSAAFDSQPYRDAMHKAAKWLVSTQDEDGCWHNFGTPFAAPGEKAYETHVSWGLFEAERVAPGGGYGDAGLKQSVWALTRQQENGWFADCCLSDPARPLTHTIGYVLRGVLEAYRLSEDAKFLEAGRKTADGLLSRVREDGFLAGRFDRNWRPAVRWSCLTGSVQIAYCWLMLFESTGDPRYLAAAQKVNAFVRRTIAIGGDPDVLGGVRGAFPIQGAYGPFEYLNWAAKFCLDAQRKEQSVTAPKAAA